MLASGSLSVFISDFYYTVGCVGYLFCVLSVFLYRLPVVILTLYNLQLSSTGKLGYYRWKEHICSFIETHWIDFFGPNRYL